MLSALTLIVAMCGYLREATLAARFGLSATMDAYFGALFIPNSLYLILIVGTLPAVFIPILLQDEKGHGPASVSETFSVITNFVLLVLVALISIGLVTARLWIPLLFPGFAGPTITLATHLVYIILPSVLFLGLAGILTAALNGFHRFAVAAVSPAISSLVVISAAVLAHGKYAIYIIGTATALGFVLQLAILVPAIASLGIRYRFRFSLQHPGITRLFRLGIPLLLYMAVANASFFVERNLASELSAGALSAVTYAMRLFTVPANFLAVPLAVVAYPQFTREALRQGRGNLRTQVSGIFRLIVFIFLPITIWIILNALPITQLLYEHGHFRQEDSLITAKVLTLYGIGILPNAIAIVLIRCFYALHDTVTPLWSVIIDLVFYVATAPFLSRHYGISGLALTRGLTFFLVGGILTFVLSARRQLLAIDLHFLWFFVRTVIATLAMAMVSWTSLHFLHSRFDSGTTTLRLTVIGLVLVTSGGAFIGVSCLLKLNEARRLLNLAWNFVPGSGSDPGF
jgi:putative peptidoglycan lipid II flippase